MNSSFGGKVENKCTLAVGKIRQLTYYFARKLKMTESMPYMKIVQQSVDFSFQNSEIQTKS